MEFPSPTPAAWDFWLVLGRGALRTLPSVQAFEEATTLLGAGSANHPETAT